MKLNLKSTRSRTCELQKAAALLPLAPTAAARTLQAMVERQPKLIQDVFSAGKVAGMLHLAENQPTETARTQLAILAQAALQDLLGIRPEKPAKAPATPKRRKSVASRPKKATAKAPTKAQRTATAKTPKDAPSAKRTTKATGQRKLARTKRT